MGQCITLRYPPCWGWAVSLCPPWSLPDLPPEQRQKLSPESSQKALSQGVFSCLPGSGCRWEYLGSVQPEALGGSLALSCLLPLPGRGRSFHPLHCNPFSLEQQFHLPGVCLPGGVIHAGISVLLLGLLLFLIVWWAGRRALGKRVSQGG